MCTPIILSVLVQSAHCFLSLSILTPRFINLLSLCVNATLRLLALKISDLHHSSFLINPLAFLFCDVSSVL